MKDSLTDIVIVLDNSSSMSMVRGVVTSQIQEFITQQRELPGEANLSLAHFDSGFLWRFMRRPLQDTSFDGFTPWGNTALVGGLGKVIDDYGKALALLHEDDRPGRVLIATFTDGEENCTPEHSWSRQYTWEGVRKQVHMQRTKYNWRFVYMGVGRLAEAAANRLGINEVEGSTFEYEPGQIGTQVALTNFTKSVGAYRSVAPALAARNGFFSKPKQDAADALAEAIKLGHAIQIAAQPQVTHFTGQNQVVDKPKKKKVGFHNHRSPTGKFAKKV